MSLVALLVGILLIGFSVATMAGYYPPFFPYVIILFGIFILISKHKGREISPMPGRAFEASSPFKYLVRFILGPVTILIGLTGLISSIESIIPFLSLNSITGLFALMLIGLIEVVTNFK